MATVVFHSSAECPELATLPRLWQAAQAVCTISLPSPSGNWTAPRPCIGSWLQAGSAKNRSAAPVHVKIDFAGIAPPSKRDLSYVRSRDLAPRFIKIPIQPGSPKQPMADVHPNVATTNPQALGLFEHEAP